MKNVVILISGRGSNMQSIVNAEIPNARIAAVLSNNPDAAGLAWAAARGIATAALNHKDFADRAAFDREMMRLIDGFAPDLVVLAGFMRILTPEFCTHYEGRCINIHPSLLPAFTGLHTHRRAIEEGCRVAGCTIHFVTAELDNGPIIAQGVVPILDGDTEEALAARVLSVEHVLFPQAVADFVAGSLHIVGRINAEGLLAQTHRAADCTLLLHQDALPQMMQGRMPDFNDVAIEGDMPLGMGILWRCAALRYSPHEDIRRLLGDENSRKTAQWAGRAGGVLQTAGQWLQQYADQMGEKQPAPAWQQQLDACRQEIEALRRQLAERDERD